MTFEERAEQLRHMLAKFGRIPDHQVEIIWNLGYDHGYKNCKIDQDNAKDCPTPPVAEMREK